MKATSVRKVITTGSIACTVCVSILWTLFYHSTNTQMFINELQTTFCYAVLGLITFWVLILMPRKNGEVHLLTEGGLLAALILIGGIVIAFVLYKMHIPITKTMVRVFITTANCILLYWWASILLADNTCLYVYDEKPSAELYEPA